MSSLLFKPTFKCIIHKPPNPKIQFFKTPSFLFFKSRTFNISCHQQSSSSQTPQPNKKNQFNPLWVLIPSLFKRWGSWFKAFSESKEESLDFFHNGGKKMDFLQSGGIGMTLLSVSSTAKLRISPFIATLAANPTFMSAMFAWMGAQSMKVVLNFFVERRWDFRLMCASGGMPSSHTALCTALTTSVALCHGVADSLFPVCLGFSLIVMYDAIGVRRHAGMQAEVLNMIVADLFQGHPISQRKLKELLGHTHSQVLAGAFLGILVACIWCKGSLVPA